MLKRIVLSIIVVVLLIGVVNLIAQEQSSPKPRPEQGQVRQGRQRQNAQAEQLHRQRGAGEAGRGPAWATDDATQPSYHRQNRAGGPQFGRWFDKLAKAYRENDNEKVGQLIRKMHRLRQRRQQTQAQGQYTEDYRSRAGMGKGRPDTDMPRRGTGIRGRGFHRQGVDRPDPGMLRPPFRRGTPDQDTPPKGMEGRGRGFQRRGRTRGGWDLPEPEARPRRPGRWID